MAVIFPRWTNRLPTILAVGTVIGLAFVVFGVWYWFSPRFTDVGYEPVQPVPFSHALHAGQLGLDCRYCHNTVEREAHAAVPPAATCMNCHRSVRTNSPKLAPVRLAYADEAPLEWKRVHLLPDYAYFDHSVHVAAGVGCASCHGRVDRMTEVMQVQALSMSWCLDCHRNPKPNLRPLDKITDMAYDPVAAGYDPDHDPQRTRSVEPPLHCSGCHR